MTDLLALALRAIDDADALPVLGDAIQEAAWFDKRVGQLMRPCPQSSRRRARAFERRDRELWFAGLPGNFARWTAKPGRAFARAVAAVLLFGDWQTWRWPLREVMVEFAWSWDRAVPDSEGAFFGINRERDPTRLAGMRVKTSDFTPDIYDRIERLYDANLITASHASEMIREAMPKESTDT
ncbi:MAG TPA: hypothetical protein VFN70_18100 [Burkholderiales bacterium]|nr:hypothetical protein [Burkholderiales bacterium]